MNYFEDESIRKISKRPAYSQFQWSPSLIFSQCQNASKIDVMALKIA